MMDTLRMYVLSTVFTYNHMKILRTRLPEDPNLLKNDQKVSLTGLMHRFCQDIIDCANACNAYSHTKHLELCTLLKYCECDSNRCIV